jgi:transcriptional regulator with PAS, ATPase and Fis domain
VATGRAAVADRSDLDLHATERVLVREALRRFGGSRKRAAKALGVSTVTLWRMIKRHGLDEGRAEP